MEFRVELEEKFRSICKYFIEYQKLDAVILGCTELPLIFPKDLDIRSINSMNVLADALLKIYFKSQI